MTRLLDREIAVRMGSVSWRALGSWATVQAPREQLVAASEEAAAMVAQIDRLASRFRCDSELAVVNRSAGRWTAISPAFAELVALALWAADVSDGAVDPTLGEELGWLGYDGDFTALRAVDPITRFELVPAPRADRRGQPWRRVRLDRRRLAICLPQNVSLDLGAVGKGHGADLAAAAAHARTGGPVLVSLGGDVAVAGDAPEDGWSIGIASDHRVAPADCDEAVRIHAGGLATSSLTARRWWQGERAVHHVLDPRDGLPVAAHWVMATVAAGTCAEANIATTAALVLGPAAPDWLQRQGLAARLVAREGPVVRLGDWPA
jgi:thiamine biosynthesis lipoprotein ApbE